MKNVKSFNDFINESIDPSDFINHGVYSNCCGATVMTGDICSECGEHCDTDDYEEEDDYVKFPEDQTHDPEFEDDGMRDDDYRMDEGKKKSRKEVMTDAKEKYPNLKPASMKKGLNKMKGKDFKDKAEKNFSWAENPEAAAAYIRKATGKEPKDA